MSEGKGITFDEVRPAGTFYRSTRDFLRALPTGARRFWLLVIVVGAFSGLSAAFLVELLRGVQAIAWGARDEGFLGAVQSASALRRLLVPLSAGVLVAAVSIAARRPLRGHGTASIIEAIWTKSGRMMLPWTLLRGVVSIIAVGLGAPLGREGALLQAGAATGSALGRKLKLSGDQTRLLVACGAAAGISAAYNVPIGGALFGLEVLLGSFALDLFGPIVVSCVVATLVSRVLVGDHPSYLIPVWELASARDLALALLLGPLLGAASALYVRMINAFSIVLEKNDPVQRVVLPVVAMLCVGVAAVWFPELLGNGYDSVNAALLGRLPLFLLLVLPLLKLVATAGASGAGIPGGLFTPSLFFGALLGGAYGALANRLGLAHAPAGAFALLGMAGVLGGTTHASVSAVLIIFEMTGNYSLILPLMVTAALAATISRLLQPQSLYSSVLKRRNVQLPESPNAHWLKATPVAQLVRRTPPVTTLDAPFEELVVRLLELPRGQDLYVVREDHVLVGALVLDALKGHLPDHQYLSSVVAADVMDPHVPRVRESMSLAEVARLFASTVSEHLPVVDERGRLVGTIAKGELIRHGRF